MNKYLSLVKFGHTIFALPFAMIGFFLATIMGNKTFDPMLFLLVLGCMVCGRNAAMAFNRYVDRKIDKANPRTENREIPSGQISENASLIFIFLNAALFSCLTWFINPLCFYLSPIALLIILGYSYTKRYTAFCHIVLGIGLSLAPVGAYLAVANQFDWIPVLYGLVVLCWVAGFDIIYALQDEDFDKNFGLNSIPVFLGRKNAMLVSKGLHILCALILIFTAYLHSSLNYTLNGWHWIGVISFLGLLGYQHTLVKEHDLSKVNLAFFTMNGIASVLFATFVILDFFL